MTENAFWASGYLRSAYEDLIVAKLRHQKYQNHKFDNDEDKIEEIKFQELLMKKIEVKFYIYKTYQNDFVNDEQNEVYQYLIKRLGSYAVSPQLMEQTLREQFS